MAAIISVFNYNPLHLPQSGCYLGKKKKQPTKTQLKTIISRRAGLSAKMIEDLKELTPMSTKQSKKKTTPTMSHKLDLGRNQASKSRHATLKTLPNPLGS